MNRTKRQIRRDRIARAVERGFGVRHGWVRSSRNDLPNLGSTTTRVLREAEQKRARRRWRNVSNKSYDFAGRGNGWITRVTASTRPWKIAR